MRTNELIITIAAIAAGTQLTRFLPFIVFPEDRETPSFVKRLQTALPSAVVGLLVMYCLKDVKLQESLPHMVAIAVTAVSYIWRNNGLLSIGAGTAAYMIIIQNTKNLFP